MADTSRYIITSEAMLLKTGGRDIISAENLTFSAYEM
jgi:hypothetical protein